MDLQPVRPAVILGDEVPGPVRRDPEDAAVRDVGDVEPALAVEDRSFDEGIDRLAAAVGVGPGTRLSCAVAVRQAGEDLGRDGRRGREEIIGGLASVGSGRDRLRPHGAGVRAADHHDADRGRQVEERHRQEPEAKLPVVIFTRPTTFTIRPPAADQVGEAIGVDAGESCRERPGREPARRQGPERPLEGVGADEGEGHRDDRHRDAAGEVEDGEAESGEQQRDRGVPGALGTAVPSGGPTGSSGQWRCRRAPR